MGKNLIISIIICTKNRPSDLSITLESIYKQICRPDFIVVVDDSDDNKTRKVIDKYSDIIYFHPSKPNSGLPEARNAGLRYVPNGTEIVLFLDDDVTLDNNYLLELNKKFKENSNFDGASGQIKDGYHNLSFPKKLIHIIIGYIIPPLVPLSIKSYHILRTGGGTTPVFIDKDPTSVEWISGCNMAYRYSLFKNKEKKFDETLIGYAMGEDALFSHKLYLNGKRFVIARKALIKHRCSSENRMPPFKKLVMIFAYRRYLIQNFTKNKTLASLYYYWFAMTFIMSIFILCLIRKQQWKYLNDALLSHWYIIEEPNILKINKFIQGENNEYTN